MDLYEQWQAIVNDVKRHGLGFVSKNVPHIHARENKNYVVSFISSRPVQAWHPATFAKEPSRRDLHTGTAGSAKGGVVKKMYWPRYINGWIFGSHFGSHTQMATFSVIHPNGDSEKWTQHFTNNPKTIWVQPLSAVRSWHYDFWICLMICLQSKTGHDSNIFEFWITDLIVMQTLGRDDGDDGQWCKVPSHHKPPAPCPERADGRRTGGHAAAERVEHSADWWLEEGWGGDGDDEQEMVRWGCNSKCIYKSMFDFKFDGAARDGF